MKLFTQLVYNIVSQFYCRYCKNISLLILKKNHPSYTIRYTFTYINHYIHPIYRYIFIYYSWSFTFKYMISISQYVDISLFINTILQLWIIYRLVSTYICEIFHAHNHPTLRADVWPIEYLQENVTLIGDRAHIRSYLDHIIVSSFALKKLTKQH